VIRVRQVERRDAPRWAAMRAALWPEEDPAALADDVERFFAEPRRGVGAMPEGVLVAQTDEAAQAVGFAEVSRRLYAEGCETSPVGFLEGWYVVPEHRRRGVGRALVAAAEAWARELGCREFASDAVADNGTSATAHRALGFEEVVIVRCFRKDLDPGEIAMGDSGSDRPAQRPRLPLELLPDVFAVCRLDAAARVPSWAEASGRFFTVSRTPAELSITALDSVVPADVPCQRGYRAFRVRGPLPLDLIGILTSIADPLARAGVSIFAISTYDTDYVLINGKELDVAIDALKHAGHEVTP